MFRAHCHPRQYKSVSILQSSLTGNEMLINGERERERERGREREREREIERGRQAGRQATVLISALREAKSRIYIFKKKEEKEIKDYSARGSF